MDKPTVRDTRLYRSNRCAAFCGKIILIFWLPVVLWMGFIFICSSTPGSDIPPLFPYQDIVFHFGVYALLAWLFSRALANTKKGTPARQVVAWAVVFCLLYGISDELHQSFVPNRTCDIWDVLLDTVGGGLGTIIFLWQPLNLSQP